MNTSNPLLPLQEALGSPIPQASLPETIFGTPKLPLETVRRRLSSEEVKTNPRIMIIDDEPINIKVVRKFLMTEGYKDFITTTEPTEAIEIINKEQPDVILLDIMMPQVSGLEILEKIRSDERFVDLPVIILTAAADPNTKLAALNGGATEFLAKPVDFVELQARVRNVLALKAHHDHLKNYAWDLELEVGIRTRELAQSQLEIIYCLARAGEFRDNETGRHILRVGHYTGIIAARLGFSPEMVDTIQRAAILHDIGKIGVPDAILLKPGRFDALEFAQMQRHCEYGKNVCASAVDSQWEIYKSHTDTGAKIVSGAISPILQMAGRIAYSHHEKWDGTGYPQGLAGEAIPIEARITAVADVFDALCSHRPYKPAYPLEKCQEIMRENRDKHFDPTVLDAFFDRLDEILRIQTEYADAD